MYDLHAANTQRLQRATERVLEPGSGTIEYPPLVISWMALAVHMLGLKDDGAGLPPGNAAAYISATRAGLSIADALGLALLVYLLRFRLKAHPVRIAAGVALYGMCVCFLYAVIYDRMDIVMATLLAAAAAALLSRPL